ncbi:hypothetical protein B0J12DRAFT_692613 [Macrophomina phaseolina]|uniref:RNA polymerase alpha subunit domain-containing protein n=1 Tax=Macrophomina phaseolina TaxID=35725 RepID=A0ABQ8FPB6_9PEZI|nr:hypothetical protein B0J12DRAFT_692613 [Macrophomina phaseolina]
MSAAIHTSTRSDERVHKAKRVVVPGRMVTVAPSVVKCVWTKLKVENLLVHTATIEHMSTNTNCWMHKNCDGHLVVNPETETYLIPYAFATGSEIKFSDGYMINRAAMVGEKGRDEMTDFCFSRIAGKNGILRKGCNGSRPTNTSRFVLSPMKTQKSGEFNPMTGVITMPRAYFDKGMFVYVTTGGFCTMRKARVGDFIVMGRCPSQGADSALPFKIVPGDEDEDVCRIPLEVCSLTNADFDGDEGWHYMPASSEGSMEVEAAWNRVWGVNGVESLMTKVMRLTPATMDMDRLDRVIYSTMTLEEMGTHPGGELYETLMLKPKSWKTMHSVMKSSTYWSTCVERFEAGITNTTLSMHGVAGPYGVMRLSMMMGTAVSTIENTPFIDSRNVPKIPLMTMPPDMDRATCASAMTKLTKILYQRGIDLSKHGVIRDKPAAIETLLSSRKSCYAIGSTNTGTTAHLTDSMDAISKRLICTNMRSISSVTTPEDMIARSVWIVAMIEEMDSVMLTPTERVAAAYLITFLGRNVDRIMNTNIVDCMYRLGLDWYTSITCSDVRWLKNVTRDISTYPDARRDMDISSTLGAIAIGNMSMVTNKTVNIGPGTTVVSNTNESRYTWTE